MTWNPTQYLAFAGPRLRPALDLLAQIPRESVASAVDLGCGPGNVTPYLRRRFPESRLVGVDSSPEMLGKARAAVPDATFVQGDIAQWAPPEPVDLIYSNAALHWLDDHAALFPALIGRLAAGGVLAVQMPRNHGAPSHRAMVAAAEAGPWRDTLAAVLREQPVAAPEVYYDILRPHVSALDIWECEYQHHLEGDNPVVEWTKGTALKPLLDALKEPAWRDGFHAAYAERIRAAYPPRANGVTLFPFRRLFIVATR